MNLSVVDYLVKPVDKVELGNLLGKDCATASRKGAKSDPQSRIG